MSLSARRLSVVLKSRTARSSLSDQGRFSATEPAVWLEWGEQSSVAILARPGGGGRLPDQQCNGWLRDRLCAGRTVLRTTVQWTKWRLQPTGPPAGRMACTAAAALRHQSAAAWRRLSLPVRRACQCVACDAACGHLVPSAQLHLRSPPDSDINPLDCVQQIKKPSLK